jgi:Transmembrane secretion effector
VVAHDSAATWMTNIFRGAPSLILLTSTPASLPLFPSTPPAGGLADKVDAQKLIRSINVGFAATATGLAVLGWPYLLNPYLTLVRAFFIGVGFVGKRWAAVAFEATVPFRLVLTPLVAKIVSLGVDDSIGGFYGRVEPIPGCRFHNRFFRPRFLAASRLGNRIQCALQSNHFLSKRSPGLYITNQSQGLLHETKVP